MFVSCMGSQFPWRKLLLSTGRVGVLSKGQFLLSVRIDR